MKINRLFFVLAALLVSHLVWGQNITVTGVVKDSSTGEGVPFASIQLKGTMTGGMTDVDGNYSISAPAEGVLIFSSVGYLNSEVAIAGKAKHDVMLAPDTQTLEETIVVAFGTATKESFTGSAKVVKSEDIAKVQSSDVTRALEGVVAGVQMTTSSGSLTAKPTIVIRGFSSINASSDPLYVVDGIPFDGNMSNLNPADIESMTVLKDAASNALYGARGANGVIMVTTKKAKLGDAVVSVDAKFGLNTKALKNYDYITAPGQYYETYYSALKNYYMTEQGMGMYDAHLLANDTMLGDTNGGGLGYLVYEYPEEMSFIGINGKLNPYATLGRFEDIDGTQFWVEPDNWMDAAYRNSIRQEYNVSVSGTTGRASIFASFGYLNNQGIVHGSDMYRYTARLRTDYQAKSWLKVGGNVSYTNYKYNNSNPSEGSSNSTANIFAIATKIAPIYPIYVRDAMGNIKKDKYGYDVYDYGTGANAGMVRPYLVNSNALQASELDKNYWYGNALNGSAYTEVNFLKDFTFTFNAGMSYEESRSTSVQNMYYGQYATVGGTVGKVQSSMLTINLQQLLSWKRTFARVHNASILLGHENYVATSNSLSGSKSQLFSMENDELNGAVVDGKASSSSRSDYNNEGYFLRAQYDYMNRMFISASYRRDASSRFHPDHRWGDFWSLGAGWILNQEEWFPRLPWIDMLKAKASIGSQGNDNIGNYLYTNTYYLSNNEGKPALNFGVRGNEDITWETNTNFNAGFDFELMRRRVTGSVEYFSRKTTDMLFFFTVPASLGYGGYYDNVGDMKNSGIEFSANFIIKRTRDFNWSAYFNVTHYKNKISYLAEDKKTLNIDGYPGYASGNYFIGEGLPLNTFYMPRFAGVDQETGESLWYRTAEDGTLVTTKEYTGNEGADSYLCGAPTPDVYGGFGTTLNYKGFDVAVAFTYSVGGLAYDSGYAGYMASPVAGSQGTNFHKDILKAWTKENPSNSIPRFQYNDQYSARMSDRFLTDASYLNFQNAQVGYTVPEVISQKMHINRMRVYLACDNIWYWSCRQGFDPRFSLTGGTNSTVTSPVRTISGGVNITF